MSTGPEVMSHSFPNMSLGSAQSRLPEKAEITLWHHFLALLPRGPICLLQSLALTLCPDTIFRCAQGKMFPPLLLDLSELGGHHKWKSPKRGLMVWFKEPKKRKKRKSQKHETYVIYLCVSLFNSHYCSMSGTILSTSSDAHFHYLSYTVNSRRTKKASIHLLYSMQVLLHNEW